MRANELLREQSNKLSLEELKAAIDGGQAPKVQPAGWSARMNSFGELAELGYMTSDETPMRGGRDRNANDWVVTQQYVGPGPVTLVRSDGTEEVINSGWTNQVEVDRS
jgi:hypothetical protein